MLDEGYRRALAVPSNRLSQLLRDAAAAERALVLDSRACLPLLGRSCGLMDGTGNH